MKTLGITTVTTAALAAGLLLYRKHAHSKSDHHLIETLKKFYPLDECVVTGNSLEFAQEPVDYLHKYKMEGKEHMRLVRFCSSDCIEKFKEDPEMYLKKIDKAAKSKGTPVLAQ